MAMATAKVYTSSHPPIPVIRRSIFTYLFEDQWSNEGAAPESPAYIDAGTNQTLSRQHVKTGALKLAWGLQNRVSLRTGGRLKTGDTIMLMSPNSLSWPVALFGCGTFLAPTPVKLKRTIQERSSGPQDLICQLLSHTTRARAPIS